MKHMLRQGHDAGQLVIQYVDVVNIYVAAGSGGSVGLASPDDRTRWPTGSPR